MPASPPRAPRRPTTLHAHDDTRDDPYFWLRDRDDPGVIEYLEAENAYTAEVLAPTAALREALFEEIRSRVQETDVSPPIRKGPWEYFNRTFEGRQYAIHGRRPAGSDDGVDEHVILDENELAGDSDYFALGGFAISPAQDLLAYSTDHNGSERYTLRIRDLTTGADLPDIIEGVYYGLAWANDGQTLFYVVPDEAVRPYQVWRHALGTSPADDVLVYEEADERFFLSVSRSRSGRYIFIPTDSKLTSEVHFLSADDPTGAFTVVEPREHGHEYSIEHHHSERDGNRFFVLTNADGAENSKVMVAPVDSPGRASWTEVLGHRPDVKVDDIDAFAGHLVISERADALERLRVRNLADGTEHVVELPDPVYSVWVAENPEFDSPDLRYGYSSLVLPASAYDYNLERRESVLVKRTPVLGGYDETAYTSARLWARAADDTEIPISLVHRKDVPIDGTAPALLYGYGSYEHSIDAMFSSVRLSLLDRGFVFAIAHVRGGGEMGRAWYEAGKLEHKPNTFTDFIACGEHLIASNYTSSDRIAARGGSAGGLLMGAVVNLRPDLFRAVVAEVPFVDVVTTMMDPSLPLTVTEWEEWGNPLDDPNAYEFMRAYSPYDNVEAKEYPALLVTAGLNDPRVGFWEPAKWVAKLRATKTDNRVLALRTELGAGHSGPSGRYDAWRDEALVLAFLVDQLTAAA